MIPWNEYRGTETNPLHLSSTGIYRGSFYYETTTILPEVNIKELIIKENVAKAIQTMVLLSGNHKLSASNLTSIKCAFRIYKILFSISGKLPKRIRHIRKGK